MFSISFHSLNCAVSSFIYSIKEQKEKMRDAKLRALGSDEFANEPEKKEAEEPDEDSDLSDEEKD